MFKYNEYLNMHNEVMYTNNNFQQLLGRNYFLKKQKFIFRNKN